jgi:hypothetical protein
MSWKIHPAPDGSFAAIAAAGPDGRPIWRQRTDHYRLLAINERLDVVRLPTWIELINIWEDGV